jgi:tryptophan synthase alpha chain
MSIPRHKVNRIVKVFERSRSQGCIALMPYLAIGYPDVETTLALAPALVEAGADIFELGIPYSDPLADGATIQRATQVALRNGVTSKVC